MQEQGLIFAAVHDSFWTHASDADQLARTLRETFTDLHTRDLIGELRKQVRVISMRDQSKRELIRRSFWIDMEIN